MLKPIYAVAAIALWASASLNQVMADDSSGPSVSTCAYGEPSDITPLDPEVLALSRIVFMKLCGQFNGDLVREGSTHSEHFTRPGKISGPSLQGFYPAESMKHNESGTVILAVVVETDGRISKVAFLKSTGHPALDKAALAWVSQVSFNSPAYLDSTPVRFYRMIKVDFHVSGSIGTEISLPSWSSPHLSRTQSPE